MCSSERLVSDCLAAGAQRWFVKLSLSLSLILSFSLSLPQVSQISSVFDCLLEEEERTLKENPVESVQWAEVVLIVNSIIKVQCRHGLVETRRGVVDRNTDRLQPCLCVGHPSNCSSVQRNQGVPLPTCREGCCGARVHPLDRYTSLSRLSLTISDDLEPAVFCSFIQLPLNMCSQMGENNLKVKEHHE